MMMGRALSFSLDPHLDGPLQQLPSWTLPPLPTPPCRGAPLKASLLRLSKATKASFGVYKAKVIAVDPAEVLLFFPFISHGRRPRSATARKRERSPPHTTAGKARQGVEFARSLAGEKGISGGKALTPISCSCQARFVLPFSPSSLCILATCERRKKKYGASALSSSIGYGVGRRKLPPLLHGPFGEVAHHVKLGVAR